MPTEHDRALCKRYDVLKKEDSTNQNAHHFAASAAFLFLDLGSVGGRITAPAFFNTFGRVRSLKDLSVFTSEPSGCRIAPSYTSLDSNP